MLIEERGGLGEATPEFAEALARGVQENLPQLDAVLGDHSEGWTVARMPAVDRAILRLACYELLHREDVPVAAVVNEAVEAAKELSTEDSGRFVNGVLGPIARMASRGGPTERL